jgi:hypothetical protein
VQQACFSVLRIYFAIAHRLTISGREKLPAHGPFVLATNHCSHLDALVLGAALKPRHRERAFPIAAGDAWGDASRLKLNCAFGVKEVGAIPSVPRTAPAFAPDQEERARPSEHHCPHIAVRGRDQPDGSPRSTRFRSRESETANAIAMS